MNDLTIPQSNDPRQINDLIFNDNSVRVFLDESGEPWFIASDVCRVLGIKNIRPNLAKLDNEDIRVYKTYTNKGIRKSSAINESGLYNLIFVSRKPQAKAFKRWVTRDVLPSIRKTGKYILPEKLKRDTLKNFSAMFFLGTLKESDLISFNLHPDDITTIKHDEELELMLLRKQAENQRLPGYLGDRED